MTDLDKSELRLAMRARRAAYVQDLDAMAHRLAFRAVPSPLGEALRGCKTVALYMAVEDEAPAQRLAEALMIYGKSLCLPRAVDRMGGMEFHAWHPNDELIEGRFGIRTPVAAAPVAQPDAIFAPLVAFDEEGNRLGQGGGYYDRAFARYPDALRIGVGWSVQQMDALPADAWDVPLHAILTERSFISIQLPEPAA